MLAFSFPVSIMFFPGDAVIRSIGAVQLWKMGAQNRHIRSAFGSAVHSLLWKEKPGASSVSDFWISGSLFSRLSDRGEQKT